MTHLERVMQDAPVEQQQQMLGWMAVMSPACQDLCHRCPPGMQIHVGDQKWYVVGYTDTSDHEHAHLLVSPVNPKEDWERSTANPMSVCPEKMSVFNIAELN